MKALNKQAHQTENERMAQSLAERNGEPIEGLRQRISELEEIATDYGMKFQKAQDALKHQALLHKSQLEAAENNLIDSECHVAELEESLRDKQALLEAAEKRIAEQREYYEGVIADGSRRMAELEAKIETADKLQDSAFRHGLQHGFSYGQTNDQAGYEQCLKSYSSRGKDNG